MSAFGLFIILFAGAMVWAGWHNYAVWDVISKVIQGGQIGAGGPTAADSRDHSGGAGLKGFLHFDWAGLTGSLLGSAGKVPGDVITGGKGEATSGGKPVPGIGGLLGGPGSKGGLLG